MQKVQTARHHVEEKANILFITNEFSFVISEHEKFLDQQPVEYGEGLLTFKVDIVREIFFFALAEPKAAAQKRSSFELALDKFGIFDFFRLLSIN